MWTCPDCGRDFERAGQDHFCRAADSVDAYIAGQPDGAREALEAVRSAIRAAAPKATERMSWRMPTFWQGENLIHFAAFQRHVGLYPGAEAMEAFADRLAGYATSKGAVRLPYGEPLDRALIEAIVRWRVDRANEGGFPRAEPAARARQPMPDFVAAALAQADLWARYDARPPYQRNDYISWIARAKREDTRQRRLAQMLDELRAGDAYMGMAYKPRA